MDVEEDDVEEIERVCNDNFGEWNEILLRKSYFSDEDVLKVVVVEEDYW